MNKPTPARSIVAPSPVPRPSLEAIWGEFAASIGSFIRARVSDPATAEDLRQDVFVKVQQGLERLQDPARLPGWIQQIARRAVIDHYRKQRPTEELPESLELEPATDPASHQELEGLKTAFRRMVDSLPEPYREAVVFVDLEGKPQTELARRLGLSSSGAKSRVQRGRQQLKAMLLDCCRFEFDRRGGLVDCTPRAQGGCPECTNPPESSGAPPPMPRS